MYNGCVYFASNNFFPFRFCSQLDVWFVLLPVAQTNHFYVFMQKSFFMPLFAHVCHIDFYVYAVWLAE